MIRAIIQNPHVKCNFCFQWFIVKNNVTNCLYLCDSCLNKALNTTSFKVPSPQGQFLYQVYLLKKHIPLKEINQGLSNIKNSLILQLEEIKKKQLSELLMKWEKIQDKLNQNKDLTCQNIGQYRNIINDPKVLPQKGNSLKIDNVYNIRIQPQKPKIENFENINQELQKIQNDRSMYSPLRSLKPKQVKSPMTNTKKRQSFQPGNSCIYYNCQNKQNAIFKSTLEKKQSIKMMNCNKSMLKKSNGSLISQQKRQRDLQAIKKDALKFKIYNYLVNESSVLPSLILVMTFQIYDAIKNTNNSNRCLQLVLFDMSEVDIKCYLTMLDWKDIQVLKLVKVGLIDEQIPALLQFLKDKQVQTLVITSNRLTQSACKQLLIHNMPVLKNIYLGRNKILRFKLKQEMKELQDKYYVYL